MLSIMNNRRRVHSKSLLSDDDKAIIAIAVSLVVLSLAAGSLSLLPIPSDNRIAFRILQIIFFVAMGCWHANGRSSRLMPLVRNGIDGRLAFTALLTTMILVALIIMYSIAGSGELLLAAASAAAFVMPFLVKEQWHLIDRDAQQRYAPWRIADGIAPPAGADTGEPLTVRIKLISGYFDKSDRVLSVTVPANASLGAAFRDALLHDHNDKSSLTPAQKSEYAWEFFRENPRTSTTIYFDPEKSLMENSIRERTIFIARRLRK